MRFLLLSPLYHPAQSPNVYRWDTIACHWIAKGHEVHWLCTRLADEQLEAMMNGIFVHRVGHHTLLDWWCNLLGIRRKRRGLPGSGMPRQNKLRKFLEDTVNLTWRKVYWPDGACLWYKPAKRKALELMARHNFDAVISVSLPFTSVRIAQAIKEKYPTVRWLMDIEDPFSFVEEYFINNRGLYKKLSVRAEERALRLSDVVSVTVEAARQKYVTHFPFVEGKIFVTPPLYDEVEPTKSLSNGLFPEKDGIHLGYFGTFYYPIRNPEGFLRLLSLIKMEYPELANRIIVHFVGAVPMEYVGIFNQFPELSGMIQFYGLVSREHAAGIMGEMNFLVNIGNSTEYHLPSKCAEYLMSGKPIINITPIQDDTFRHFMKNYPLILNLIISENQPNASQLQAFMTFIIEKNGKQVEMKTRHELGAKYTVEAIAERYFSYLS